MNKLAIIPIFFLTMCGTAPVVDPPAHACSLPLDGSPANCPDERDLIFLKIKYSSKFTSKQNKEITLGSAYVNKNLITTIGKKTNKYPKNLKKGIYDFIQSSP